MSPHIQQWKAEHENYRRLLDLLDTLSQRFSGSDRPEYELMLDITYYMTRIRTASITRAKTSRSRPCSNVIRRHSAWLTNSLVSTWI